MSFISELTWKCIELQGSLENPEISEEVKNDLIVKHFDSLEGSASKRDTFPEFGTGESYFFQWCMLHLKSNEYKGIKNFFRIFTLGWEWFNTKRALTVGEDFKNQIVVVDFFTYCCINCMHILPDLHALEEKYPSQEAGVVVVSVTGKRVSRFFLVYSIGF